MHTKCAKQCMSCHRGPLILPCTGDDDWIFGLDKAAAQPIAEGTLAQPPSPEQHAGRPAEQQCAASLHRHAVPAEPSIGQPLPVRQTFHFANTLQLGAAGSTPEACGSAEGAAAA